MADFAPSSLSPATRILLAVLLGANFLMLAALLWPEDPPIPVVKNPLPRDTGPLTLLGELSESERSALTAAQNRPAPRATFPEDPPALVCRAFGPFTSDETLEPAQIAVAEVTDQLEVVESQLAADPDYLVYLDSDNNLDNARRLQKELEGQEIEAYVIAGGDFVNSVSAGVFSRRASADRLYSRLEDLGYAPRIQALERAQTVRHLVARVPVGFSLEGVPTAACGEIASRGEFL